MVDPQVIEGLVERTRARHRLEGLSPRELEVHSLMAKGRGNQRIAEELVITEKAVQKHLNALFTKLGLPDSRAARRVQAVLTFLAH